MDAEIANIALSFELKSAAKDELPSQRSGQESGANVSAAGRIRLSVTRSSAADYIDDAQSAAGSLSR
jgi:hypothetical protein